MISLENVGYCTSYNAVQFMGNTFQLEVDTNFVGKKKKRSIFMTVVPTMERAERKKK